MRRVSSIISRSGKRSDSGICVNDDVSSNERVEFLAHEIERDSAAFSNLYFFLNKIKIKDNISIF